MNYIDEMFSRADIQQIREFLLHGAECDTDPRPYEERINDAQRRVASRLCADYPNNEEYEEIMGLVYGYVNAVQDVHMELGLRLGAILTGQVYMNAP